MIGKLEVEKVLKFVSAYRYGVRFTDIEVGTNTDRGDLMTILTSLVNQKVLLRMNKHGNTLYFVRR